MSTTREVAQTKQDAHHISTISAVDLLILSVRLYYLENLVLILCYLVPCSLC
jgi:hypothetical protein